LTVDIKRVTRIVLCACALHNICTAKKEDYVNLEDIVEYTGWPRIMYRRVTVHSFWPNQGSELKGHYAKERENLPLMDFFSSIFSNLSYRGESFEKENQPCRNNRFFLWPLEGMTAFHAVEEKRSLTPFSQRLQCVSQL